MTALQTIIKEAKSLRAKNPKKYKKWTDYVKEASKNYSAKNKSKKKLVSKKVVKKKITKKKVVKKAIGKKRISKKIIAKKPTEKVILKKVHSAKTTSKNLFNKLDKLDEAQHAHMMGKMGEVAPYIIDDYKKTILNINQLKKSLPSLEYTLKFDKSAPIGLKNMRKKIIKTIKNLIKEKKIHANQLKKLL